MALNSSQEYADSYNKAIAGYQDRINNELFGSWVNTTAVTLNSTLVEFYDEVEKGEAHFWIFSEEDNTNESSALNASFGSTILYNPINTFIYCILGSKITNLERGLTWISEHAFIDLPTFPSDILLLSNDSMNEIATPIAAAAVGSGDDNDDDGIVGTLISHFESALKVERTFYGILLGVWLALFLIGLAVVIWHSGGREKFMALRGVPSFSSPPGYGPPEPKHPRWKAWLNNNHPIYDSYAEKQFRGTTPTNPPENYAHIEVSNANKGNGGDEKSFCKMRDPHAARLSGSHASSAVRSTTASLAGPVQSLFKVTGRKLIGTLTLYDNEVPLVPTHTCEKYPRDLANSPFPRPSSEPSESMAAQLFWVDKFYGVFEGVKSLFPTRGQRHGAALAREAGQRTEGSLGTSQSATSQSQSPGHDWIGGHQDLPEKRARAEWSIFDPEMMGRTLGKDQGRYPKVLPSSEMAAESYDPQPVYPRPMSRAPTVGEGMVIPSTEFYVNNFQNTHPPKNNQDSNDYFEEYESSHSSFSRDNNRHGAMTPPATSSMSYFAAGPRLVSASKVRVGVGQEEGEATRPLIGILKELQEKRLREDPFGDR